jgi:hypothetical protein
MRNKITGRHKQRAEIPQSVDFFALFTLILRRIASILAGEVHSGPDFCWNPKRIESLTSLYIQFS